MGFFQKKPLSSPAHGLDGLPAGNGSATRGPSSSLTPAPSSDPVEEPESLRKVPVKVEDNGLAVGLPSPITPANAAVLNKEDNIDGSLQFDSPSRKVGYVPPPLPPLITQTTGKESDQLRRVW